MKKSESLEIFTVLAVLLSLTAEFHSIARAQSVFSHACDNPATDSEIQSCVMDCQIPCEDDDILDLDCKAIEQNCGFKLVYVGGVK